MAHSLTVVSTENQSMSKVLTDLITSASYFGQKDIMVYQRRNESTFVFEGDCPKKYIRYLKRKYELIEEQI